MAQRPQQPNEWMVNHTREASQVADMHAMAAMNSLSMAALEKTSTQYGSVQDASGKQSFSSDVRTSEQPSSQLQRQKTNQDQATASAHIHIGRQPTHAQPAAAIASPPATHHPVKPSYNDRRAQQYLYVRNRRVQFFHNVLLALVVALMGIVPGVLRIQDNNRGADIAMIVLGGVAGLILATHYVMLFWDKAELEFEKERQMKATSHA